MRISSGTLFASNVSLLGQLQTQLQQTQQQVASGHRTPDNPAAAAHAIDVTQSDAMNTQYAANRTAANSTLSMAEGTLQSVTSLLQDVRTATVNAGSGALNSSDRKTIATDLSGRLQELIGLANSTDGIGNYLFAGFQSKTQPFVATPAGISYLGDDGQRNVQVSATRQMASSDSGANVFMRVKSGNGTFDTQAAPANTGTGLISQGSVNNPAGLTGDSYTVLFSGPSAAPAPGNTGSGVISTPTVVNQAAVTGSDYSVVFGVGGTTYTVNNLTTGLPVTGAQPYSSGQAISFDGLQFNIQNAPAAGDTFVVSSPGYTVTDTTTLPAPAVVLPAPPAIGRVPYVSGQAISFGGMQFDVQGAPANGDAFTVKPSANESVFKTISDLINVLNAPVVGASLTNSLNHGLNNLDNALNNVLTTRSSLGSRLNEIDAMNSAGADMGLQFKQTLSGLQDTDYNKAISDLTRQQMVLQAAQQSFAKIAPLSLFNYL